MCLPVRVCKRIQLGISLSSFAPLRQLSRNLQPVIPGHILFFSENYKKCALCRPRGKKVYYFLLLI